MGAQLRVYRRRIRSVQNIKKITRAMELIATSRIVKAQQRVTASKPYADTMREVIAATAEQSGVEHPLVSPREQSRRAAVVVLTSDRGLAGGYSANVLKAAEGVLRRLTDEGKEVAVYAVGRKAVGYFRFRGRELAGSFTGFSEQPSYADAKAVAEPLVERFSSLDEADRVDEIHLCSTSFVSMLTQRARVEKVLPLDPSDVLEGGRAGEGGEHGGGEREGGERDGAGTGRGEGGRSGPRALYEFEPAPEAVLDALLPRYVEATLYAHLLEAAASESAARRRAMKSATDNAEELIKNYTRLANTARQAEITQEISEIVGGADALASSG